MRDPVSAYQSKIDKVIDSVCKWQTALTVIFLPLLTWASGEGDRALGKFASILVLVSIPSAAWVGRAIIRDYERSGWRKETPRVDIGGQWRTTSTYSRTYQLLPVNRRTPDVKGIAIFEQSPHETRLASAKIYDDTGREIGSWSSTACSVYPDGSGLTLIYSMDDQPDTELRRQRSHGRGVTEIVVTEWELGGPSSRPTKMVGTWYDCARLDAQEGAEDVLYIGTTTYTRL